MADQLQTFDLNTLTMEEVQRLKNAALDRLKASGSLQLEQPSHQNGTHASHTNHGTHSNSVVPIDPVESVLPIDHSETGRGRIETNRP